MWPVQKHLSYNSIAEYVILFLLTEEQSMVLLLAASLKNEQRKYSEFFKLFE